MDESKWKTTAKNGNYAKTSIFFVCSVRTCANRISHVRVQRCHHLARSRVLGPKRGDGRHRQREKDGRGARVCEHSLTRSGQNG